MKKTRLYMVKESGRFSYREFGCFNVGYFLLRIVVFVFLWCTERCTFFWESLKFSCLTNPCYKISEERGIKGMFQN